MFLFTFCAAIHNNHIANDTWSQEFLLNGPTNEMGMVVTAGGVSQHQPLWWSDTFRGAAYSYPYVLVMGRLTITVHSILDQKEKQVRWFKDYFRVSGIVNPLLCPAYQFSGFRQEPGFPGYTLIPILSGLLWCGGVNPLHYR